MTPHLFVYGTLMPSAHGASIGKAERARLHREGVTLGAGSIAGRLYDLGRYPAMVEPTSEGQRVFGEILRLGDPASAFPWLDAYENAVPDAAHRDYDRVTRPVLLTSSEELTCWVYLYRGDVTRARLVAGGRWRPA